MIHRDYILRMIEEFMRMLSSIAYLKQGKQWRELEGTVDEEFKRLTGATASEALALSDTELSARLMRGEGTLVVQQKIRFLVRLFKEAGDAATAQGHQEQARAYYVKGLDLLLQDSDMDAPFSQPDYLPRVEAFTAALADEPIPGRTAALLMHYYERTGMFARAEDTLFRMLDELGDSREAIEFGIAFYERLRAQSDAVLMAGDLPRTEVETGLAELHGRKTGLSGG